MRQSAFIIHRCGDGRRQIAGTKANVYGVFTSCTWTRRRRETEGSVRYQSDFLFRFFFFRAKARERSSGLHRRILDFYLAVGRVCARFYWISKIKRRRDTVVEFERKMRPRIHTYGDEKLVLSNFSLRRNENRK